MLASPSALTKTSMMMKRARVAFRIEPIPSADEITRSGDEQLYRELVEDDPEGFAGHDDRLWAFAKRLAADSAHVTRTIARLLERGNYAGPTEPRVVRSFERPNERTKLRRGDVEAKAPAGRDRGDPLHREARNGAVHGDGRPALDVKLARGPRSGPFVPFRVSWGGEQGADARRLLAMVCRRGEVRGADVGNIRIARGFSVVEIAADAADAFAETVAKPDPRNPRVFIKRDASVAHATPARRPPGQGAKRGPMRHTAEPHASERHHP